MIVKLSTVGLLISLAERVMGDDIDGHNNRGYCYTKYVHVSVVKQVPSYSKHCAKVGQIKY